MPSVDPRIDLRERFEQIAEILFFDSHTRIRHADSDPSLNDGRVDANTPLFGELDAVGK